MDGMLSQDEINALLSGMNTGGDDTSDSSSATTTVYFIFLLFSLTVKLSSGYSFSFYIIEDSYPLFHKYISTQICKILRLYTQQ